MLKSCKLLALLQPLLCLALVKDSAASASQNLSLRGLVRRDRQPARSTDRTNAFRSSTYLLASTTTTPGKKRRRVRKSGDDNNAITNLGTKETLQSPEDDTALSLESTKATKSTVDTTKQQEDKMPSLFMQPEEVIYDKYAACLAATEGLRRARDATLGKNRSAVNVNAKPTKSMAKFWRREDEQSDDGSKKEYQRACAQYVLHSGKMIRSMGLSVSQFNQLGREVGSDKILKERVMEQAYLYRMAATVNMGKIPLIEDPNSKQLLKSHRRRRVQMFVQSITEIEDLRAEQTKRLQNALNIDALPPTIKISDPAILPILDPRVRAVVEAFPLQAEEIVKKYGLNSDEFNQMLEENRTNPVFRRRVKNYMQKHDALVKGFDECKIPDNP
mmetsp:Transcript_12189/g.14335  ORF Transcript_12189/g.14335 Transcript_12189/m.14335 type:complete len:388 (+) Transcript_12189:56-1219(+)